MKKDEYEKLDILEQIKYIEERRSKGEGMKHITYSLGYNEGNEISIYFKEKQYRYDVYLKKYVKIESLPKLDKIEKQEISELLEHKSDILEMLEYYKSNAKKVQIQQLDINSIPKELQKDIKSKSIKVYAPVYNLFDSLCNEYISIKKQDIISLALYEFYKKHKKD